MNYLSVKETSAKFGISERRIQKLCEQDRINGAEKFSGVWLIPEDAEKPMDERANTQPDTLFGNMTLGDACRELRISVATGKNWLRLGKLVPSSSVGNRQYFDSGYISKLKHQISSGEKDMLKSRRNKKFVSGCGVYNDYVSPGCEGEASVTETLSLVSSCEEEMNEDLMRCVLADASVQMLSLKFSGERVHLFDFLDGSGDVFYAQLVRDVLGGSQGAVECVKRHPEICEVEYSFAEKEDVLGLLYISCMNIGSRKASGQYFTPTAVVRKAVSCLGLDAGAECVTVLDPCCGTGNFILQLPDSVNPQNVYGNDTDALGVAICRVNAVLRYGAKEMDMVYTNFTVFDYLTEYNHSSFDYIIGNPPWGFDFCAEETKKLGAMYETARGRKAESYDLFVEKAISDARKGGTVCFVLPEAILNVAMHCPVRQIIFRSTSVSYIEYLGNVFDGVQCPSVILNLKKTENGLSCTGTEVVKDGERFMIGAEREMDPACFNFSMTDTEYDVMRKICTAPNLHFLEDNADFALGIVTGGNKGLVSDTQTPGSEPVLKGSDVFKFRYRKSGNFIRFDPKSFQQTAPEKYYRAEEKLLYRFICGSLVFAYDNKKTLSLNSCNVLIPKLEKMTCKYVLAILNSRVAQFYFKKNFNSIKVLRSHIEKIPIPEASEDGRRAAETIVDRLLAASDEETPSLYEELDALISSFYGLNATDCKILKDSLTGKNLFLVCSPEKSQSFYF
ncbi:MAG: N-6 DNA methylase [Clostridia bacterium]|nr:N-6 DNA methylase [Clostridia bacterium]